MDYYLISIYKQFQSYTNTEQKLEFLKSLYKENLQYEIHYHNLIKHYQYNI